jgi:hypothetical protein
MNNFYAILPYVLIFLQTISAAIVARLIANSRPATPRWPIVFGAALPIPLLLAGFAVFAFILVGRLADCDVTACANDQAAFVTLLVAAFALYALGLLTAFLGTRPRKKTADVNPE